jgi:transcriptional regulator of acetoin/glycerol metabolism
LSPARPPGPAKRPAFDLRAIEKQELIEALQKTGSNQSRAAELLGISRVTVYNRMKRYGINTSRVVDAPRSAGDLT